MSNPKFEDTYLALVFRQAAPRLRRVALVAAALAAVVSTPLLVYRDAQWIDWRVKVLQPKATGISPEPPVSVHKNLNQNAVAAQTKRGKGQAGVSAKPVASSVPISSRVPSPERPRIHQGATLLAGDHEGKESAPSRPVLISLPEGTFITVALTQRIATNRNEAGTAFKAVLTQDIMSDDGHVLAPARSEVSGRIVDSHDGSRETNPALTLALETVQGFAGPIQVATEPLVIEGRRESRAKRILRGVGGAVAGAVVGSRVEGKKGAILGAALGTVIATTGNSLDLPASTVVQFAVAPRSTQLRPSRAR